MDLAYLWGAFVELRNAGAVSFGEIAAYQALTGHDLDPWEVETLRTLDMIFQQEQAKQWQK